MATYRITRLSPCGLFAPRPWAIVDSAGQVLTLAGVRYYQREKHAACALRALEGRS